MYDVLGVSYTCPILTLRCYFLLRSTSYSSYFLHSPLIPRCIIFVFTFLFLSTPNFPVFLPLYSSLLPSFPTSPSLLPAPLASLLPPPLITPPLPLTPKSRRKGEKHKGGKTRPPHPRLKLHQRLFLDQSRLPSPSSP